MGLVAVYYLETEISLEEAALRIANEQSAGLTDNDIGQFSSLVIARGLAEVLSIEPCEVRSGDLRLPTSLPNGALTQRRSAALVRIGFPDVDIEAGLDSVLNAVFGEPQNLGVLQALQLIDLEFDPPSPSGPRHGLDGLRSRLRVPARPLVCAPIKPSTGLDMSDHVGQAISAAQGGADIVKDDELCLDTVYNPLLGRVTQIVARLKHEQDRSGEGRIYIANLIGRRSTLNDRLRIAEGAGAEALMVAPSLMGFDVIQHLREQSDLYLFAHSSFTLSFSRVPGFGMALPLWVRLQRLMGADGVLLPSHGGSFGVSASDTRESVAACLEPDLPSLPRRAAPAHSGSMNALTLRLIRELSGGNDFIFTSGSGLFDHPDGPAAGARALRAVVEGQDAGDTGWLKSWRSTD